MEKPIIYGVVLDRKLVRGSNLAGLQPLSASALFQKETCFEAPKSVHKATLATLAHQLSPISRSPQTGHSNKRTLSVSVIIAMPSESDASSRGHISEKEQQNDSDSGAYYSGLEYYESQIPHVVVGSTLLPCQEDAILGRK